MKILVETSARHVHVTDETLEKLFGKGYQLTVKKMLSQPGQYASNERVTVVGPKRELANVSILGPRARWIKLSSALQMPAASALRRLCADPAMWLAPAHASWWARQARWSLARASSLQNVIYI